MPVLGQANWSFLTHDKKEVRTYLITEKDLHMDPEEISTLVGDGNARVSVAVGLSDKEYGTGYDTHVSVSLTCNQDPGTIGFAYVAASNLAKEYVRDSYEMSRETFQNRLREDDV